jgi:hypothetical protein
LNRLICLNSSVFVYLFVVVFKFNIKFSLLLLVVILQLLGSVAVRHLGSEHRHCSLSGNRPRGMYATCKANPVGVRNLEGELHGNRIHFNKLTTKLNIFFTASDDGDYITHHYYSKQIHHN